MGHLSLFELFVADSTGLFFFKEGSDIVGEVTWVTLVTVAPDK